MKPAPFEYVRPTSVAEALRFLSEHPDDAKLLAGGQSLIPVLSLRLSRMQYLVDIGRLPELEGITPTSDGGLRLGALTRHRELISSTLIRERAPLLRMAAEQIGHPGIRNRGTLGGSIAHADPAAELPAVLIALDATIVVQGPAGERRISAHDFFVTIFTTALELEELITAVELPPPILRSGWAFIELARRHGDFAMAGVAAGMVAAEGICTMARVVLIGVGDIPIQSIAAEKVLVGELLTSALVAEAARAVGPELDPPDDLHATGEYRRELAQVLTERALLQAWERSGTS